MSADDFTAGGEDIQEATPSEQAYLATGTVPNIGVDGNTETTPAQGYTADYSSIDALLQGSNEVSGYLDSSPVAIFNSGVSADPAAQARTESGGVGKSLWDSTKDVLGAKGDSVGAMLLAMALKGVGNLGTQKQNNRALDIQQGHLDLARQKQNNAQTSMHGVTVNMKAKPFAPLPSTGMINTGRV